MLILDIDQMVLDAVEYKSGSRAKVELLKKGVTVVVHCTGADAHQICNLFIGLLCAAVAKEFQFPGRQGLLRMLFVLDGRVQELARDHFVKIKPVFMH